MARNLLRDEQIQSLALHDLRAEIEAHRNARWRRSRLLEHVKAHRAGWTEHFGQPLTPSEVTGISRDILEHPNRVFTRLEPDGAVTYVFVGQPNPDTIVVVATRRGLIRTAYPERNLDDWRQVHVEFVEVPSNVWNA